MRLIDADELLDELKWFESSVSEYNKEEVRSYICRVEAAPTVDAVPVVHGRWVKSEPGYSICGYCKADVAIFSGHRNYCPNCGAKMNGGAEDG